jgi:predicted nuclease of predicted toxin-antitoxin system
MKVLLDQGLPRAAARLLRNAGIDAVHTAECGLATAADLEILAFARREDRVVVTLDADFHAHLVLGNASRPSVIRIRIEGLHGEALAELVRTVLARCTTELAKGAMVSVTEDRIRVHGLPARRN